MSYLDILDRITDDFGKHRLTDVMEEENEDDGRFSNSRNRFSSIGSTASSIDHLWDIHPRRLSEAGLSSHADSSAVLTEDTDSFIIGQKVWVSGTKPGHIAFIGETQFAPGEWAGIALDEPIGKNDGSVGGIRYFMCEPKKGVFARLTRLTRFPLAQEGMGSGETYVTHSPVGNGVRKSPISPTGSTRGTMKSPSSINGSNLSLYSSASHVIDYKLGDRVIIKSSQGSKVGMVRYIGTTDFATGEWVGVELDEPRGKNDGSVNGKRYFECRPNFGLFAPASKVSKSPSKVKPSSCQIHSSSSGLPPSGILKRTNSKESMLSNISMTSVTSSARRVRLGVTSLTPKKPPLKASPAPIPTRTALQDVLKEKQLHIEQLLKERDLERAEITKAANQTEEAEQRLTVLRQEYDKYRSECEVQLQEHISLLNKLKADRNELVAQFDEEKRKSEDLAFRLAESSIFKEDVEVANENNLKRIKELEEKLQKERDKVETLESDANKLFEAEENLIRAKEEIESLRNQLQETRGKQQILEGDNASTSVLISSLQKEVDQYKRDVEERDEMISVLKQEITKVTTDFKKQMGETVNQKTEIEALCIVKDEEIAKIKLEVEQVNKLLQNKIIELEKITNEKLSSESVFEKQLDKLKMELSSKSYNQETIAQECKEKDDAISELKKQLEVVKIQIQEKSSEFEVLKTELSKQISERNNVIDEYKLQTSKLQENITMLNSDLEKTNLNWQTTVTDTTKRFTDIIEDKTLRINELELQAQDVTKENITANQKLEELNKNFDSKCGELDSLKIQNENLVKECNDFKMNVAELQKDSDSLKGKESLIQTLQTELQTTKVDLESVSSNLSQYQTNMSDVESSLKKERDELKESLKAKIVELEDAKKVFSDSIALKEEELKELSVTLSKKTTDADKLQKDFEISKEKTDNYIQEIVQKHVSEVKSKEEELTGIMNELNVKVKQVNDFEVEVKELREQLIQKSSEYQKLSEEMESKMKDNSSQLTVILTAQNEVEQFKKATEQLEIKCGDLTKTNIELEDSNRKQNDLIDLKAKEIEQYEIITKQKTDEINFLKSELSTTNERLGNTIKELENYQSNLSDVETNLKKEKNDLQNALDAKNLELGTIKQEMTDKISLLEKTLSEFNLNNELKSQEIADLTAKNIAIWTEIKNLTCNTFNFFNESPPTREHDLSMLSDCLNKWQDHVKARECTINELQESLKLSTNKLTDNDSKIPELEHKIQEITKLSQETKKSLDQVQNENEMLKLELSNKSEASVHYNDKISSLTKLIEDKEKALLTLNSDFQAKVEVLENTIKELNENKSELQLSIQKQKDEYDDIIKTISDSETDLRNRIESNKDSDRVKELESKLSEIITKLGEKDKIIFSQNEELAKTKDELSKIKSLHNGLNQPSISVQPDSNQTNESPKYQQLLEEKIFAESQVAFLNSIIVDMQKKNETQQARIEILEMGYNATAADELVSLGFIRGEKIPAPRMYCDICEEFDLHETEDCPTQADDEQPNVKLVHQDQKEKPLPRPYCEICEEFSHATEDCTNVDQEF